MNHRPSTSRSCHRRAAWLVAALTCAVPDVYAAPQPSEPCARPLVRRTAKEVLASHRAALEAGEWAAVRCNYAADAVVVTDAGVTAGRDVIVADLKRIGEIFGGRIPVVHAEVVVSILDQATEMARIVFSIESPCIDIRDGVDTYIIRDGLIQAQTAHGAPVIKCSQPS